MSLYSQNISNNPLTLNGLITGNYDVLYVDGVPVSTNVVPYTGATMTVDLNNQNLNNVNTLTGTSASFGVYYTISNVFFASSVQWYITITTNTSPFTLGQSVTIVGCTNYPTLQGTYVVTGTGTSNILLGSPPSGFTTSTYYYPINGYIFLSNTGSLSSTTATVVNGSFIAGLTAPTVISTDSSTNVATTSFVTTAVATCIAKTGTNSGVNTTMNLTNSGNVLITQPYTSSQVGTSQFPVLQVNASGIVVGVSYAVSNYSTSGVVGGIFYLTSSPMYAFPGNGSVPVNVTIYGCTNYPLLNGTWPCYGVTGSNKYQLVNSPYNSPLDPSTVALSGAYMYISSTGNITAMNGNFITGLTTYGLSSGTYIACTSTTSAVPSVGVNGGTGDRLILYQGTGSTYPASIGMQGSNQVWFSSPLQFYWYCNGTTMMTLSSTQLVVNSTSTNVNNLNISSTGKIFSNNSSVGAPAVFGGGAGDRIQFNSAGGSSYPYAIGLDTGTLWYNTPTSAQHSFFIAGTNRMNLTSTVFRTLGLLSVTDGLTSISAGVGTAVYTDATLLVLGSTTSDGANIVNFQCQASQYGRNILYMTGRYEGGNDAWAFNSCRNGIIFRTQSTIGSAYTNRFTIQNYNNQLGIMSAGQGSNPIMVFNDNGNIGIGVTNPVALLSVAGSVAISNLVQSGNTWGTIGTLASWTANGNMIQFASSAGGTSSGLGITVDSTGNPWMLALQPNVSWRGFNAIANNFAFYTNTSATTGLFIANSGQVGIGTTNPGYKLTLSGTGDVFAVDNQTSFTAKNSAGTYETYLWPRWDDNKTYFNYGSGGWNIRNSSSTTVGFFNNAGNLSLNGLIAQNANYGYVVSGINGSNLMYSQMVFKPFAYSGAWGTGVSLTSFNKASDNSMLYISGYAGYYVTSGTTNTINIRVFASSTGSYYYFSQANCINATYNHTWIPINAYFSGFSGSISIYMYMSGPNWVTDASDAFNISCQILPN